METGLVFLYPWVLAGLVFLPLLWLLLRVTPPAPRLVVFPAARFLEGLEPERRTASRTPWQILLLRLAAAALVVAALAGPVLNPASALPGTGPVLIAVDNGWEAAQTWDLQTEKARALIVRAAREGREISVMTTAPEPGKTSPSFEGPLTRAQAEALLRGLAPLPWPADYEAAAKTAVERTKNHGSLSAFWLSAGLDGRRSGDLAAALRRKGSLQLFAPPPERLPLLLHPPEGAGFSVRVEAPAGAPPAIIPVAAQAAGADGRIFDSRSVSIDSKQNPAVEIVLDVPEGLRGQIGRIALAGRKGAGASVLLDDRFLRRAVGIAAPQGASGTAPLTEADFYIRRALEPYAAIEAGGLADLLKKNLSVIILPDVGALPADELNALEQWVRGGGLLLRFAGPNMTQGESFLTPVPLRKGGRAMDGALTWEKPVRLAPFPEKSPFAGLEIPPDVTVRRQILADPVPGIEKKAWATLDDGTPLITAAPLDKGLMVLVHTTATAEWSDLALSGLYVQMLRRITSLAGGNAKTRNAGGGLMQPLRVMDGFGVPGPPEGYVLPIESALFEKTVPGATHPPGLYGSAGVQGALNLGGRIAMPAALPASLNAAPYTDGGREKDMAPLLLAFSFILFLADWAIVIALQSGAGTGRGPRIRRPAAAAAALLLFLLALRPGPVFALTDADYAGNIYLAYVATGAPSVDESVRRGLESLRETLIQRTSVEPAGVVALDPERDDLSFFPLIYWPVAPDRPALSDKALGNVQNYLDHGGTVLFDTRDRNSAPRGGAEGAGRNGPALRRMIGGLNIPPLVPMKPDHVLSKSFYLMKTFPGRYDSGAIWVEEKSANGRDGVSSVIVGSHDWAGAWGAGGDISARQQELALRFGVNAMMYALTGNYKADQVHLPHILERLGQ